MIVAEFVGLLAVIVFAAYLLSRGAEVLAEKWGCNIVGSIILALVTTLPEYAFVYCASQMGRYQEAIGSAIGSCTLLITLGYGLVIVLATSRVSKNPVTEIKLSNATRIDALYLLITGIVAFVFVWHDNILSLTEAIILTFILFGYVFQVFKKSAGSKSPCVHDVPPKAVVRGIVEMLIGGALVFVCSHPFVASMISLAELMHVSPVFVFIVLGPIASEMPEKLTAYLVVLKNGKNAEISVCNFIGSKVNHNSLLLAVMPFVAYFHGHEVVKGLKSINFLVMTVLTVVVSGLLVKGRLRNWHGWVLVGAYIVAMIIAGKTPMAPVHH